MNEKRKYIIIIGAMKSGTTTLFDVLAQHPRIAPARNKEPGFFAFEDVRAKGFAWFDTLFDFDAERHVYRLEASTDYTKAPFVTGVWERMTARADVDVRLLYIMRDPLRRIESHARHVQVARKEIGQQISPRADHDLDAGLSAVNLAISRYACQLDAYQAAWEAGKLHCLTLDDLRMCTEATMAGIWSFLDLDAPRDTGLPRRLPRRNAAGPRRQTHPAWEALIRMPALMGVAKAVMPAGIRQRIRALFHREVKAHGRFELTPEETDVLAALYRPEIARLRRVYSVRIPETWDDPSA